MANLRLCGVPFTRGFFSKDLILNMASSGLRNFLTQVLLFVGVGLTASYSARSIFLCSWSAKRSSSLTWEDDTNKNHFFCCAVLILIRLAGARAMGYFFQDYLLALPPFSANEKFVVFTIIAVGAISGGRIAYGGFLNHSPRFN